MPSILQRSAPKQHQSFPFPFMWMMAWQVRTRMKRQGSSRISFRHCSLKQDSCFESWCLVSQMSAAPWMTSLRKTILSGHHRIACIYQSFRNWMRLPAWYLSLSHWGYSIHCDTCQECIGFRDSKNLWCIRLVWSYYHNTKDPFQQLWEAKLGWGEVVPEEIHEHWNKWRNEPPILCNQLIPPCYFPTAARVVTFQLHGFCNASEVAYAGVVYLQMVDCDDAIHNIIGNC